MWEYLQPGPGWRYLHSHPSPCSAASSRAQGIQHHRAAASQHCTSGCQKQLHHLRTESEKSSRTVSGRKGVKRSKGSLSFRKASFPPPSNGLKTPELSVCLEARSIWYLDARVCRVCISFGCYHWGWPSLSFH